MTIVIVQARLGSTRLPGKGLLQLGKGTVLGHTLEVMKNVPADLYYLATDYNSYEQLLPIATENGFKCFQGPEEDVLERFCLVIEETSADIVVRATGDNPFLFCDAAKASLERFKELQQNENCDYFTYSGLPHGCGIEVFSGKALLLAKKNTIDPFDHEHVGPALYNHKDLFNCLFEKAPSKWNYPLLRTTIDTYEDYRRALRIEKKLSEYEYNITQNSVAIIKAVESDYVKNPILFVPSVEKGHGTGHLRRCLALCKELNADIFIPPNASLEQSEALIESSGIENWQIINDINNLIGQDKNPIVKYNLIITDLFVANENYINLLSKLGPVIGIDEGTSKTEIYDYLLDIIPSCQLKRKPNILNPSFIPKPENKKSEEVTKIKKVIVTIGGEDPSNFTDYVVSLCKKNNLDVTIVDSSKPIKNLKEQLYLYDLVITHYGFTAFEALATGCKVLLVATSPLHKKLAEYYGFCCISKKESNKKFFSLINNPSILEKNIIKEKISGEDNSLECFIQSMSKARQYFCPVCKEKHDNGKCLEKKDSVVSRATNKTVRRCRNCGMLYLSYVTTTEEKYDESYFFEDYKKQYGKTYLEDFDSIKKQGIRRMSFIELAQKKKATKSNNKSQSILDIGCAYGPFLAAANEFNWEPYGTDINKSAVEYVNNTLKFPAVCGPFPNIDLIKSFNITEARNLQFDAVTMWYVIEHFENLHTVLCEVSALLKSGGVFAFATPNANGVSATFSKESFFENSPKDHFSIWEMKKCKQILKKYGFQVVKVVSTGHHPERFPLLKQRDAKQDVKSKIKNNKKQNTTFLWNVLLLVSKLFKLGDTFEVYAVKRNKNDR